MAKTVDITEKLEFGENPKIVIKGEEYEVNSDAETVLKIMGVLGDGNDASPRAAIKMYELLFGEKTRERISRLKLQFKDLQKVIEEAISLVVGDEDSQGES